MNERKRRLYVKDRTVQYSTVLYLQRALNGSENNSIERGRKRIVWLPRWYSKTEYEADISLIVSGPAGVTRYKSLSCVEP